MSLQVWLPLNGSLENKGLSQATFSIKNNNNKLVSGDAGKVCPQVYKRSAIATSDYITSNINFSLTNDFSMCCWCKVNEVANTTTANGIITIHDHTTGGAGITLKVANANTCYMSCNTGFGPSHPSQRTFNTYYGTTNIFGAWHHLCLTYTKSSEKYNLYVDGVCEKTFNFKNDGSPRPFCLFAWSTGYLNYTDYRPACELNDVRLYDHCLSPREIKLLAQGLVAHYKLDNGNPNLLNTLSGTREAGYYNYKFDRNGFGRFLTNGETCTLTICFTPTSNFQKFRPHFDNGNVPCTADYPSNYDSSISNGQKQIITLACASNYSGSNTPTTTNTVADLRLYVRRNSDSAYDSSVVTIHWVKLQIGTHTNINTWSPSISEQASYYNTEYDCSGCGNYLLQTGNVINIDASPRYSSAVNFNQTGYFKTDNFNLTTQQFTCAFWIKAPSTTTDQHFLFGTHNNWTNNGFSAWRDKNGSSYSVIIRSDAETSHSGFGFSFNANAWEHIVYTYTGAELIGYRNGIEFNRSTYGKNGNVLLPVLYLGNSLFSSAAASETDEASMSDFRIYATALSAAAVKELYQSSISFLDNGTLQCSEIVESPTNLKYNKNGIINANLLSEVGYTNKMKTKTLSDGSAWARVFYHKNHAGNVLFTSIDEVLNTTTTDKFSRLNQLSHFKGPDNKYEFLLTFKALNNATTFDNQYNRWKQSNLPQDEWQDNTDSGSAVANGYEAISIAWNTNYWGGLGRQNFDTTSMNSCFIDGSIGHSNWFFAIGAKEAWGGGVPGPNSSAVEETELWVRIDNLPKLTKLSMFDDALQMHQIYEL